MSRNKCGCGCKSGSCGGCCSGKGKDDFIQKFSGIVAADSGGVGTTSYFGDRGVGASAGALTTPINYPASRSRKIERLTVNLQSTVPADASLVFQLVKNGTLVANTAITFSPSGTATGIQSLKLASALHLSVEDTYDLVATGTGVAPLYSVSAEVAGKLG